MGRISFQKRERNEAAGKEANGQRKLEKSGQAVSPSQTTPEIVELAGPKF
jgi:hypothetical protein